jgi:hypothetical protein
MKLSHDRLLLSLSNSTTWLPCPDAATPEIEAVRRRRERPQVPNVQDDEMLQSKGDEHEAASRIVGAQGLETADIALVAVGGVASIAADAVSVLEGGDDVVLHDRPSCASTMLARRGE